ncbi:MAG: hypothetical protein WBA07_13060 [Rivularia sp. (in: cyanobacteria)]
MTYCDNKSKAIVKVDDEIIHISKNPAITVQVESESRCRMTYIEYEFQYQRRLGDGYEEQWINVSNGVEVYSPVNNAIRIVEVPEIDGFKIELLCRGLKRDGCNDSLIWQQLLSYGGERARNVLITQNVFLYQEGASIYVLKINNKNGIEEYLRFYENQPEFEVFCGCDIEKEIECKSDNEAGFCCIPCQDIVTKLVALGNKLNV